ncbi:MAG: penicillin-binding protein, partial [Clostridia bacterium]|nr:penicillin-binding protein [Clostridia bacterium]
VSKMKNVLGLQEYATAQNCLETMLDEYSLGHVITPDVRTVMGVRYSMELEDWTRSNPYTFAEDVSQETVLRISECSAILKCVNVEEVAYREYPNGDAAAHLIGTVGAIYAEEYAELKDSGYGMNDELGKSGIEKEYESFLRGTNGTKRVIRDENNIVIDTEYITEAETGNTLVLTIDIDLQRATQHALADCIHAIQKTGGYMTGEDCNAGSAVVLDCRTGEVLAAVSYPYYDLTTYKKNYASLLENEASPLFNRALNGLYAPGSTFKPAMAVAALQERVISASETVCCKKFYTVDDFTVKCLSHHGDVDVKTALTVSCNYFFYEMGMRLGVNKMNDYCRRLGLGSVTGIGLGESRGTLAGREQRQANNRSWSIADTLQAAIGQSDNRFTPIQLANYIATIGNGGNHYQTTIIKTIKSYGLDKTIVEDSSSNPTLLNTLEVDEAALETVRDSLLSVTTEGTAVSVFGGYEVRVGGKTGTAQGAGSDSGLFIAFAPFNNPEIAVAIIGEHAVHGSWMAPVAKGIFDEYFFGVRSQGETLQVANGLLQ